MGGSFDEPWAGADQRAVRAVRCSRTAPAASDVPGGVVQLTGTIEMQLTGGCDHMIDVAFRESGAEKYSTDLDIVRDVAAQSSDNGFLRSRSRISTAIAAFLTDARKCFEPCS